MMVTSPKNNRQLFYCAIFLFTLLCLNTPGAMAAERASDWRPTYDLVMKWVNFGLLAFILVKYLKDPLKEFFFGQKAMVARQIEKLEQEKEEKVQKITATQEMLADSDTRLAELKERMLQQGEREKEKIIEAARQQSSFILEGAKRKVAHRIQQAKTNFRAELIDMAVTAAAQQLPSQVNESDNQKLVNKFLTDTQA